jgi:hypothetical protein
MRPKLKEDPKEWRNFMLIWCAAVLIITAISVWRGWMSRPLQLTACSASAVAGLIAISHPPTFRGFYRVTMSVSFAVGQVLGKVILGAVYVLLVTPLGVTLRLTGKDLLQTRRPADVHSYWKKARASGRLDQQF